MADLKEYVITLKDKNDLDGFYEDMETPGGSLYIPDRSIDVANRRPISRNTHYWLSEDEAEQIKNDPRVSSISLTSKELGLVVVPSYVQTETSWNKSSSNTRTHKNWGLLRCTEGSQRFNWGNNGTTSVTGTIQVNAEGRNVDVLIVDGFINPLHPEYALNADGTGGSRVIQYNWLQGSGTYIYEPYVDTLNANRTADNNHGAHVAGTACGNTQGWARQSNIYNINPYSTDVNGVNVDLLFDYIRAWHNSKPVNPETGRRNPTVCNNSWGFGYGGISISLVTSVRYRGTIYNGPFTSSQLINSYGIFNNGTAIYSPARYLPVDADVEDAIDDGIIVIGAASNDYTKIESYGGIDYDNYYSLSGQIIYYHRGSSPGAALRVNPPVPGDFTPTTICVGSIGAATNEAKSTFSNNGPRIDIFAPGSNIMSSFNSTTSYGGTDDPRNSTYKIGKISGTSMASPQVCGVLACALEIYPHMTQDHARDYLVYYSKKNQITDTGGGYGDFTALSGSENRYLYYYEERKNTGQVYPKKDYFIRQQTKVRYPRSRIRLKY